MISGATSLVSKMVYFKETLTRINIPDLSSI